MMRHPSIARFSSRTCALALTLGLGFSGAASGHDFWIEPTDFSPEDGRKVAIELRVGESWSGQAVPRNPSGFVRFEDVDPMAIGSGREVAGVAGVSPAGFLEADAARSSLVLYDGAPRFHRLRPERFELYLREEGLEHVVAERLQRGESESLGREQYSRCAKSLVGATVDGFDRPVGLTLELVPELDPATLAAGEELPVRLLYDGRPIEGVLVQALAKAAPEERIERRTDAAGRVRLPLDRQGPWLVKAVHMVRWEEQPDGQPDGQPDRISDADWRSWWASLTFLGPQK